MARTKSYIKLAEETLVHAENWKDVYFELKNVPEGAIAERIAKINEEIPKMQSELVNRQTVVRTGMGAKQRNPEVNEQVIAELLDVLSQLQGEKNILERFPKVERNMELIFNARQTIYKRSAQEREAYVAAKERLEKAEAEMKAFEEAENELDGEISEAEEAVKSAKGKTVKAAMSKVLEELKDKKGKIGNREKLEKELESAKADTEKYRNGIMGLQSAFDKTANPWEKLFLGMGWKDISSLTEQKLHQMIGMPKKRKEEKPEEKPDGNGGANGSGDSGKGKDKGKGENSGAGSRGGNNGTGIGAGVPPKPNPDPQKPDDEEPELPDDDEQEFPDDDNKENIWSKRHKILGKIGFLANMMNNREAKKRAKREKMESFERAFEEKNNGTPGFLDKLCARFPRLGKLLGRDFKELMWDNEEFEAELAASAEESSSEKPNDESEDKTKGKKELSPEEREAIFEEAQKLLRRNVPKEEILKQVEASLAKLSPAERAERKQIAEEILEQTKIKEEDAKADAEFRRARNAMERDLDSRRMVIGQTMKSLDIEQLQSGLDIWIAEGMYTYEDVLEVARRTAQRTGKPLENGELKPIIPNLSSKDKEEMRGRIDKQLKCLTPEEVQARSSAWVALNLYSLDEIKGIQERSEKQAQEAKERKARMLGKKEVSASRQRHRDFGAKINQDAKESSQNKGDNVPKVEAELVSTPNYSAGRSSAKATSAPGKGGSTR